MKRKLIFVFLFFHNYIYIYTKGRIGKNLNGRPCLILETVGAKTQSSVIGEVKVEVLLNKEGNFRGTIFNRQNEIQYSAEEEGYTQGVGLSYQVNFNNLSGLFTKIGLRNKSKNKKIKKLKKDSLYLKANKLINLNKNNLIIQIQIQIDKLIHQNHKK